MSDNKLFVIFFGLIITLIGHFFIQSNIIKNKFKECEKVCLPYEVHSASDKECGCLTSVIVKEK